tara:strand:- start:1162 stop:1872 length:711 start_codon:yes stop_codon:yes gene_type:complete
MKKIVAIHQPNFFPWLGYFDKIVSSDLFVFLDDVQFQQKGSCWGNRVKLLIAGAPKWISAPIIRKSSLPKYNEIVFDENQPWRWKMKKTLVANYSKTPFYLEVSELIEDILNQKTDNLTEFNIYMIKSILRFLDYESTELVKSSALFLSSSSTQRLIDIVKAVGGNSYLAGGGAQGYQEDQLYKEQGVGLIYQNYQHPQYQQNSHEFVPGLSIIDALMNVGKDEVRSLLFNAGENV